MYTELGPRIEHAGDFRKILADAERFADFLRQAGVGNVKVVEVPLTLTSVYVTPEKEGKVFVCGAETSIDSKGRLHESKKPRGFWIDVDSKNKTEYVNHKVMERAA